MPSERPTPADLAAAADELLSECRSLRGALAELAELPDEELEDACARHLSAMRSLGARLSRAVAALRRGRRELAREPDHLRAGIDAAAEESARVLQSCAELYARLARRTEEALADVKAQMAEVRRGGQALRSYARGARTRA